MGGWEGGRRVDQTCWLLSLVAVFVRGQVHVKGEERILSY